jgi:hypothetical protein
MTLDDWLACTELWTLPLELAVFSDRKLHLLTAAFLRRVWDRLPSHHSRFAVEAAEQFADGLISVDALAWARSQASRESEEWIWLAEDSFDDHILLAGSVCDCPMCAGPSHYECRVAKQGGILDGVRRGLADPARIAAEAAFYTVALENPAAAQDRGSLAWEWEWRCLFATVREILGEGDSPDPLWPQWRTTDVLALARGIYRDRAFDRMPILADALQDAGCADEDVLWHCRRPGGHMRGCWVVDMAMGIE